MSDETAIEKNNGLLFILLSNKNNKYINYDLIYENLRENSQVMITPYDIFFTLLHIVDSKSEIDKDSSYRTGNSLFKKIKRKFRN